MPWNRQGKARWLQGYARCNSKARAVCVGIPLANAKTMPNADTREPPSRTRRARNGNYPYNTHNERYTETFLFILYQVESSGTRPEPPLQAAASSGTPPETAAFVATTEVLDSSLSVVVP